MIHYKYTVKKTTDVSFRIIWSLLQKQYLEISTACKEDSDLFHPYSECNEYISSKTMPHKCSNQGELKKKGFSKWKPYISLVSIWRCNFKSHGIMPAGKWNRFFSKGKRLPWKTAVMEKDHDL